MTEQDWHKQASLWLAAAGYTASFDWLNHVHPQMTDLSEKDDADLPDPEELYPPDQGWFSPGDFDLNLSDEELDQQWKERLAAARAEVRASQGRRARCKAWAAHRVLLLLKLVEAGYNLYDEDSRKQFAYWVFPDIKDKKIRGNKLRKALSELENLMNYAKNCATTFLR